jgi:rifampicin phosphotransferase
MHAVSPGADAARLSVDLGGLLMSELPDRWLTDWSINPMFPLLTRANAGEVLPDPASPLGWSLVWEQAILPGWREAAIYDYVAVTADEMPERETPVVGHHGGYLYINGSAARVFGVRGPGLTPEAIDFVYFGDHPDVPPYTPEPWHENAEVTEKLGAWMGSVVMAEDLPELREDRTLAEEARASRPDLSKLSDGDLVERARSLLPLIQHLFRRHLTITAGSSIGPGILAAVTAAMGDPGMTMRLVAGVGDVDSAAPSLAMWELSRLPEGSAAYDQAMVEFMGKFGSRGPNEWDIRSDTWETTPELVEVLVRLMRATPDSDAPNFRNDERVADRQALTAQLTEALAGDPATQGQFLAGLHSAQLYLQGRERAKTNVIRVIQEVRLAIRELADRHEYSTSEICMLLADELDAFVADPNEYRARLAAREEQYLALFDLEPPFIINGTVAPLSEWKRKDRSALEQVAVGDVLTGVPGCPGVATGRARVVMHPSDPFALEPGDVLVAPLTDPAWTPLFIPAAAVIVDVGAQVSHAVIVSRELGIPCVVSVTDATRRIPDGAMVTVDGTNGTVTVIDG